MDNLNKYLVRDDTSVLDTLKAVDHGAKGAVVIINASNKVIGVVTDGDIRRAIINHASLESKISEVMTKSFVHASEDMKPDQMIVLMVRHKVKHIPILTADNTLKDFKTLDELVRSNKIDNYLVVMAGGLGTRLHPFTYTTPKPLLPIGHRPILETIIEHARNHGIYNILISVNYKSEDIENYFGDGTAFGVSIEYIIEEEALGTAGAIQYAQHKLSRPFFVINGDILTKVEYKDMLNNHLQSESFISVGIRDYKTEIPYGVIKVEGSTIVDIEEKPSLDYLINAGIYVISPEAVKFIPEKKFFHMTDLIKTAIEHHQKVSSYYINNYWLDVGKINDYYKANIEQTYLLI